MAARETVYTHGHHESVLRSHRWRTADNSAAYLLPAGGTRPNCPPSAIGGNAALTHDGRAYRRFLGLPYMDSSGRFSLPPGSGDGHAAARYSWLSCGSSSPGAASTTRDGCPPI